MNYDRKEYEAGLMAEALKPLPKMYVTPTAQILGTPPVTMSLVPDPLNAVLTERGNRYGVFSKHASVTQDIKRVLFNCRQRESLAPDQVEALEMIAHKLGRIVNGDPNYADSWVDIAGYAKLVADRLEGVEK